MTNQKENKVASDEELNQTLNELTEAIPGLPQSQVLETLGQAHLMAQSATTDQQKEFTSRLLTACEQEARNRGVPPEIVEIVKVQAEQGKFVTQ